ncbi:MAG TPA: nucleotide exchange factor GrpE [archaeon]|nr:nucleotide exchange factor GrpE [archaeon]
MEKKSNKAGHEKHGEKAGNENGLMRKIAELEAASLDYRETLQRLQAEFENSWKRAEKEKDEFRKLSNAELVKEFLPAIDSLAEAEKQALGKSNNEMAQGMERIRKQILGVLEKNGVKKIDSLGAKFNPEMHECLMTSNEKEKDDNIVLEELQKGYTINGKVLRPAKVKVNKREWEND